jgi:molecular chaperone GrpE
MSNREEKTMPQETATTTADLNIDENSKDTSPMNEPMGDDAESEKLRQELAELKDKYIRLNAEFDNFRKRTSKERLELSQLAGKEVIYPLLEVLDDCDRADKQLKQVEDVKLLREGINLIFQKFRNVLHTKGLKAMESIGTEFNTDLHEAITEIPAPAPEQVGKVIDEVEKGYYLNEKIIRFAKVIVGK